MRSGSTSFVSVGASAAAACAGVIVVSRAATSSLSSSPSRASATRSSLAVSRPSVSASGSSRRSALSWRSNSRNSERDVNNRYGSSTPRVTKSSTRTPM